MPRGNHALLPYLARFVAVLHPAMDDVAPILADLLYGEFRACVSASLSRTHTRAHRGLTLSLSLTCPLRLRVGATGEFRAFTRHRHEGNLETKLRNVRFQAELFKFKLIRPFTIFNCLQV